MSLRAMSEITHHGSTNPKGRELAALSLGALGVVYGDIGTSPLYAFKACFGAEHAIPVTPDNILGLLSLFFWSLLCVVVIKYLMFVLLADNQGEGGILALLALIIPKGQNERKTRSQVVLVMLGLFGAALLYGDGMITPAISVLSAVEGIGVATPALEPYVVWIAVAILSGIFYVQKHGTQKVGAVFGPATLLWFLAISAAGLPWILKQPGVLAAMNPIYGIQFFIRHGLHGFLVLGAVVLCVTGGEALYADMGHFGRKPIKYAWFFVAWPALLTNYFGQGALLLERGASAAANPFYSLVDGWVLYPMVAIATVATVVASQALISGAFSISRQAVQLGYSPRVTIVHTSGREEGQIYVPEINALLWVACIGLVVGFKTSSNLEAAYGIAVTGTMLITSILFFAVMRVRWGTARAGAIVAFFIVFDLAFLGANIVKIAHGGWFPLAIGVVMFAIMTTWKRGRQALYDFVVGKTLPMDEFMDELDREHPQRVKGTAVFMTSNPDGAPPVLVHHVRHNKVLHKRVVLLSILTERVPEISSKKRVEIRNLSHGIYHVTARYGFMQTPNVPELMKECHKSGIHAEEDQTTYYLGRETLRTDGDSGLVGWRKSLFAFLSRNSRGATYFFDIPPDRVVEIGMQIQL